MAGEPYVIGEACVDITDRACVDVRPAQCIDRMELEAPWAAAVEQPAPE